MNTWRERARRLKTEMVALSLAVRHPRTPWYAKFVVAGVVAYAVTPVDLFPDVVPISASSTTSFSSRSPWASR